MASVVIIDYGSGNLRSVAKAFELYTSSVTVSSGASALSSASHIVLPGVGAFSDCIAGLKALPDMIDALKEQVFEQGKYFLGICVGMQMLFDNGHEHGVHKGLGWLKGDVVALPSKGQKIPHMGWNELTLHNPSPLLSGINNCDHAYFVHSYYAKLADDSQLLASTSYGEVIPAIVGKDNIYGTQFHPEKSQKTGLRILENFIKL